MKDNRLDRLVRLRDILEEAVSGCDSKRDLAALSRQYRETLKEIEEIEGAGKHDDEIAVILRTRKSAGRAGSVRKGRAGV